MSRFQRLLFALFAGFLFSFTASVVVAMPLRYMVETVSGITGSIGHVNGGPGTSLLTRPSAICQGRNEDELLFGTQGYFRNFSRSTKMTGILLGDGTVQILDGTWSQARIDGPRGCVRGIFNQKMIVYFVEGQSSLRYFTSNYVHTVTISINLSFTDVKLYEGKLYITEQTKDEVWGCDIDADGAPVSCALKTGFKCDYGKYHGITVTKLGVFVVGESAAGICHFDMHGNKISVLGGNYIDVFSLPSDELYIMSYTELLHLRVIGSAMVVEKFAGRSDATCPPLIDGYDFTLCKNLRLFVIEQSEMYLATTLNTVRSVTLPPAIVWIELPPPPLPIGYPNDNEVMKKIIQLMNEELNKHLGTNGTYVSQETMHVDANTWATKFAVMVQQQDFENATTPGEVLTTHFARTKQFVKDYYDRVNEVLYMDTSIMPFCNDTMLNAVMHRLVTVVREVLSFPLIYANPPEVRKEFDFENITTMKLLMPASFNNDTTREALMDADMDAALLQILRELYGPEHVVTLVFPMPQYDFSKLTDEQLVEVRWFILDLVRARLEECAVLSVDGVGASVSSHSSVCEAVITNRTETVVSHPPFNIQSEYEVFVPSRYKFNASLCLDGIDWTVLEELIKNYTEENKPRHKSACDRSCIIGLAVLAALVLTALIAVMVVLTSKRRRLAAVVAPVHPKFKSTLDEDEEEMETTNPLEVKDEQRARDMY
ncbi:FLA1-binding protein [Trypanosoma cruzi]|uniref:FLA1-binding protein n=2 Tax=Trypanosoma cruzi TaxID=5693 RepID=A0A2V2WAV8_TRYCR|nr:FLA1-binding protein [Trypanosoma cruzi]